MILVTGATGNVGASAVEWLLSHNHSVRAGVRDHRKIFREGCVDIALFDWMDYRTWEGALEGVEGIVLIRPPAMADVESTLNRFLTHAEWRGCKKVAFLSVAGVESKSWVPHYKIEQHLRRSSMAWTFLRAGFFSQNLIDSYLPDIHRGEIRVPAGKGKVAWVDARDLGEAAARVLVDGIWEQRTPVLTGPQAIGFREVSRILTETLGTEVRYNPCSIVGYLLHLKRRHRLPFVQCLVQTVLHVGLRKGDAAEIRDDLRLILGRVPRTFADFVDDHLKAFRRA